MNCALQALARILVGFVLVLVLVLSEVLLKYVGLYDVCGHRVVSKQIDLINRIKIKFRHLYEIRDEEAIILMHAKFDGVFYFVFVLSLTHHGNVRIIDVSRYSIRCI